MFQRFFKAALFTFLLYLIVTACFISIQTSASTSNSFGIPDISPRELPKVIYHAPMKTKDNAYIKTYNQAVQYYNNKEYAKASYFLKKLSIEYRDGGSALFLLGICYYMLHENETAIETLTKSSIAGYKSNEIKDYLYYSLTGAAEDFLNKKDFRAAIANYKKALQYGSEPAILHNTIYAYLELSKTLKKTDRVPMLLYAYEFIKKNNYQADNLAIIANNLANCVFNPPVIEWFDRVADCLQDSLIYTDDPYLHYSMGYIYLYHNKPAQAKKEFKLVIDRYPHSKYYQFSLDCYLDLGQARYLHRLLYPIKVTAGFADITSLEAKLLVQAPQSYSLQIVHNQKVEFNNKPVPFRIITDDFGVRYLEIKLKGNFIEGWNELTVLSDLELEQRRFDPNYIGGYKLADFRQNEPRYKLLTGRSVLIDIYDPQIQKMAAEIRQATRSTNLLDLVRGVYYYVVNSMEYKVTGGLVEKLGIKRALKNQNAAVCEDYAIITVALLRALKIPASYFSGDIYQKTAGHAWAVFYTPNYQSIPLDTTWGDTSGNPDLYFLWSSCLPITRSLTCESNLMPGSTAISINTTSDPGILTVLGEEKVKIERL